MSDRDGDMRTRAWSSLDMGFSLHEPHGTATARAKEPYRIQRDAFRVGCLVRPSILCWLVVASQAPDDPSLPMIVCIGVERSMLDESRALFASHHHIIGRFRWGGAGGAPGGASRSAGGGRAVVRYISPPVRRPGGPCDGQQAPFYSKGCSGGARKP